MRQPVTKEKQREYAQRHLALHPLTQKQKAQKAVWNKEWIEKNRVRYNQFKRDYRVILKQSAMLRYGNGKIECKQCGFNDIDALCLDHINNDGAAHRKTMGLAGRGQAPGATIYAWVKKENYPPGFQVLCANCNMIKQQKWLRQQR